MLSHCCYPIYQHFISTWCTEMNYKSPAYTPQHSNNPCSYHAPYNTYLPFYGTRDHYNYSPHPLQPKQLKRHPKNPPKPTWTAPLRSWVYEPTLMSRFDPVIFTNLLQFAYRLVRHLSDLPGVGTEHHAPDLAPGKKPGENGVPQGSREDYLSVWTRQKGSLVVSSIILDIV